jgi:hypothetical protein
MFRKTASSSQPDLFSSPSNLLRKRAAKKYNDPNAWHNLFFKLVTTNINETIFVPLYKDGNMDAPNASIRFLVAMLFSKKVLAVATSTCLKSVNLTCSHAKRWDWSILMTFPLHWILIIFSAAVSVTTRRNMV